MPCFLLKIRARLRDRPAKRISGALVLLLTGFSTAEGSTQTIAFTQTQPVLENSAVDVLTSGEPGAFTNIPLPAGLEFPWDIDYNAATDRFFVVGAGLDDGTAPPGRVFNFNNRGTIWSFKPDGSDPVQHASGLDRPLYLDVSSDGQTVYFAEQGEGEAGSFQNNGRIGRLDVATNGIETVVTAPVDGGPTGVYLDEATNTLYYQVNNRGSDIAMQQIRRVNAAATATDIPQGGDDLFLANPVPADGTLDDAEEFTVLSAGRNAQVHDGFLYFTFTNNNLNDPAVAVSEIRRISLDFHLATDDPESFETVVGPGIDAKRIFDFEIIAGSMYFTDPELNHVYRVALGPDGLADGVPTVVTTGEGRFSSVPVGIAVVPQPPSFASWADRIGLPQAASAPGDRAGPLQLPNLLAYAYAIDPRNASGSDLPQIVESDAPGAEGQLRFRFRRNVSAGDLELEVQSSPDLSPGSWTVVPAQSTVVLETLSENGERVEVVEIEQGGNPPDRIFYRLDVSLE